MQNSRIYTIAILVIISLSVTQSRKVSQIIQCIQSSKYLNDQTDLFAICEGVPTDKKCAKSVVGMQQCFINNECYKQSIEQQMNVHCWNCWADYMTESDTIRYFQDDVQKCKWEQKTSVSIVALLVLILGIWMY